MGGCRHQKARKDNKRMNLGAKESASLDDWGRHKKQSVQTLRVLPSENKQERSNRKGKAGRGEFEADLPEWRQGVNIEKAGARS